MTRTKTILAPTFSSTLILGVLMAACDLGSSNGGLDPADASSAGTGGTSPAAGGASGGTNVGAGGGCLFGRQYATAPGDDSAPCNPGDGGTPGTGGLWAYAGASGNGATGGVAGGFGSEVGVGGTGGDVGACGAGGYMPSSTGGGWVCATGGNGGSGGGLGDQGGAGGTTVAICSSPQAWSEASQGGQCNAGQEGTSCSDGCGICGCNAGHWSCRGYACAFSCPVTPPREGDSCAGCCSNLQPCDYACGGDAGTPDGGTWTCVHTFGSFSTGAWHRTNACIH